MRTKQEKEYFLDEEPEYSQGDGARRDEETNAVLDELVFVRLNSRSDVVQVFVQLRLYRLHGVIRGLELVPKSQFPFGCCSGLCSAASLSSARCDSWPGARPEVSPSRGSGQAAGRRSSCQARTLSPSAAWRAPAWWPRSPSASCSAAAPASSGSRS